MGFSDSTPRPDALVRSSYDYYRVGRFDPDSILRKVQVPILALFGAEDRHIPMPISAVRLETALREAGRAEYDVRVFPGAGHGIRLVPPGDFERLRRRPGAAQPPRPEHPEFRPYVEAWLDRHVAAVRPPPTG